MAGLVQGSTGTQLASVNVVGCVAFDDLVEEFGAILSATLRSLEQGPFIARMSPNREVRPKYQPLPVRSTV